MKAVAQNTELEFQRLLEHHPSKQKIHMSNILQQGILMKDDGNDEVSNGTPKNLIPSNGVVIWDGMLKLCSKLDHATHL